MVTTKEKALPEKKRRLAIRKEVIRNLAAGTPPPAQAENAEDISYPQHCTR